MFAVPEQYRLTQKVAKSTSHISREVLELITDVSSGNNGYFFLPRTRGGKGYYFLVRALEVDGWNCIAVNIPIEARSPTVEELQLVRAYFWDSARDVTFTFQAGTEPYLGGQTRWVHLWQPQDPSLVALPPIMDQTFARPPFFKRLYRTVKKELVNQWKK